ncbi:Bgt-20273 [Blumeria graminis f. sp. tritici]|uniref:Bgt-20273 n=2 Tax=Blumeria graminis f. sp. tritici TaxID=62690 RepID=A0A9X9QCV8_BLUGR|nr:Bgt-20273 [Blumeria graminis f. sp. tritici]
MVVFPPLLNYRLVLYLYKLVNPVHSLLYKPRSIFGLCLRHLLRFDCCLSLGGNLSF